MAHRGSRPIDTWPVPPNWSPRDWFEEMRAEAVAAAWEAEQDFDASRGVPLPAFVHQRVLARARTRYRREWSYARRCGLPLHGDDSDGATPDGFSSVEVSESLRHGLRRLPEPQRRLIESLYWDEKTQAEVARMFSLRQPAISKRQRRILDQLRRWMDRSEKRGPSEK